jgi:hypothetical protein
MAKTLAVKFGPGLLETYPVDAAKPLANGILRLDLSAVLEDVNGRTADDGWYPGGLRCSEAFQ